MGQATVYKYTVKGCIISDRQHQSLEQNSTSEAVLQHSLSQQSLYSDCSGQQLFALQCPVTFHQTKTYDPVTEFFFEDKGERGTCEGSLSSEILRSGPPPKAFLTDSKLTEVNGSWCCRIRPTVFQMRGHWDRMGIVSLNLEAKIAIWFCSLRYFMRWSFFIVA